MKGHGQHGIVGVHVQEHAMQICGSAKCCLVVTGPALGLPQTLDLVNVCTKNQVINNNFQSNISDEGDWTTWDSWGACAGTCNADMRQRQMLFSGNRPCSGTSTDTGPCDCKYIRKKSIILRRTQVIMNQVQSN